MPWKGPTTSPAINASTASEHLMIKHSRGTLTTARKRLSKRPLKINSNQETDRAASRASCSAGQVVLLVLTADITIILEKGVLPAEELLSLKGMTQR